MARHCYVVGCPNGDYRLLRWSGVKCDLHGSFRGTEDCSCEKPFSLYTFPSAKKQPLKRKEWLQILRRADPQNTAKLLEPSKDHRVCSHHFVDGEPTQAHPNPSLKLGYKRVVDTEEETPRTKRQRRRCPVPCEVPSKDSEEPNPSTSVNPKRDFEFNKFLVVFSTFSILVFLWRKAVDEKDNLKKENMKLRNENLRLRNKILFTTRTKITSKILKTNSDSKFFTGLPTLSDFFVLHKSVAKFVCRRWRGAKNSILKGRRYISSPRRFGPPKKLTTEDELLLTLMKLRLGLLYDDLAKRFEISTSLCTQIFNSWLTALYQTFGKTVKWYPKDHVIATKPARFRSLPDLRSIIDCSEVFIETPKDLNLQNSTWSNYKHHNTVKFLISIAPNSQITFVSQCYGSRSSDKSIVQASHFLDKFDPHDMIMADKGFNIAEDCSIRSLQLLVPPGKRGNSQMSVAAVKKTKKIANLRILVEQAIRRLKTFRLLRNQLPISLMPSIDKIVTVCAALTNLMPPIYKS